MDTLEQKIWKTYMTAGTGHILTKDGRTIPVLATTIRSRNGILTAESETLGSVCIAKKDIKDARPAH